MAKLPLAYSFLKPDALMLPSGNASLAASSSLSGVSSAISALSGM
jgi:hypothetical protein